VGPSKPLDLWLLSNENLAHVQLSDIADVPREMAADTDRILPGEGTSPPDDLVARLREIGYEGAVAVELHNPALWRVPPRQFGEIAMTCLRKVLGHAAMWRGLASREGGRLSGTAGGRQVSQGVSIETPIVTLACSDLRRVAFPNAWR